MVDQGKQVFLLGSQFYLGPSGKNEREKKTGIGYGTPGRALQLDDALRNFSLDGDHFRSLQEPLLWRVMLTPRQFV